MKSGAIMPMESNPERVEHLPLRLNSTLSGLLIPLTDYPGFHPGLVIFNPFGILRSC
jgi:ABC-type uncharacterized transport system permease subunit